MNESQKKVTLEDLNEMANDLLVCRLTIKNHEDRLEALISSNPEMVALRALIDSGKMQRDVAQNALIEAMRDNALKSWKTERANFARASRVSAQIDPEYKKSIEKALKAGDEVDHW